jgi:hypothetical protein
MEEDDPLAVLRVHVKGLAAAVEARCVPCASAAASLEAATFAGVAAGGVCKEVLLRA